jgi:cytochrome c oxidase subunit I
MYDVAKSGPFSARDHKSIAMLYLGWTMGLFLLAALLAGFLRLEAVSGNEIDQSLLNQMLTYHGVIMVFMFLVPVIPTVLGYFLLPLQLGAAEMAMPKLTRVGFVLFALGTIGVLASLVKYPVGTGWTFNTPYSLIDGGSLAFMAGGLAMIALSWVLTGVNIIATVHNRRAPGLGLLDVPILSWSLYLTAFVLVVAGLAFAAIIVALAVANLTAKGPFAGQADPLLWQNAFWFVTTPAAFFAVLPAIGVVTDVIAGISRKALTGRRIVMASLVVLLAVGFASWGTHMTGSGQEPGLGFAFGVISLVAVIPIALIAYCWLATLSRGAIACAAPTTYTLAFLLNGGIGAALGLFLLNPSVGAYLASTLFTTAYIHYVMMGGVVTALLAGLHFWWPRITGRDYDPLLGRVSGFVYLVGLNMAFFPQIIMGTRGVPQGVHTVPADMTGLHTVSAVGIYLLLGSLVIVIYNLVRSLTSGARAVSDPWGAATREWSPEP